VVASCHSYGTGRIFADAGVPHVICIEQDRTIKKDEAAAKFTNVFYSALYTSFLPICKAYASAMKLINDIFGSEEVSKFMLLTPESHQPKQCRPLLTDILREGKIKNYTVTPRIMKIPSKVAPFLFRNKDMYDVLNMMINLNHQAIQIYSMPGYGKSALTRNLTNYISERPIFKDGIIYINAG
jgi:hypothetical protein